MGVTMMSNVYDLQRNNGWCPLGKPIKVIKYREVC